MKPIKVVTRPDRKSEWGGRALWVDTISDSDDDVYAVCVHKDGVVGLHLLQFEMKVVEVKSINDRLLTNDN